MFCFFKRLHLHSQKVLLFSLRMLLGRKCVYRSCPLAIHSHNQRRRQGFWAPWKYITLGPTTRPRPRQPSTIAVTTPPEPNPLIHALNNSTCTGLHLSCSPILTAQYVLTLSCENITLCSAGNCNSLFYIRLTFLTIDLNNHLLWCKRLFNNNVFEWNILNMNA